MKIDDKIKDEKLQYDIDREAVKISALSSGKIDMYEYLTDKEILLFDQSRIIEKAKFTYSSSGKAFENKQKRLRSKEKNKLKLWEVLDPEKLKSVEGLFPREMKNDEIKNKIDEIKKWENKLSKMI